MLLLIYKIAANFDENFVQPRENNDLEFALVVVISAFILSKDLAVSTACVFFKKEPKDFKDESTLSCTTLVVFWWEVEHKVLDRMDIL